MIDHSSQWILSQDLSLRCLVLLLLIDLFLNKHFILHFQTKIYRKLNLTALTEVCLS